MFVSLSNGEVNLKALFARCVLQMFLVFQREFYLKTNYSSRLLTSDIEKGHNAKLTYQQRLLNWLCYNQGIILAVREKRGRQLTVQEV